LPVETTFSEPEKQELVQAQLNLRPLLLVQPTKFDWRQQMEAPNPMSLEICGSCYKIQKIDNLKNQKRETKRTVEREQLVQAQRMSAE
jgi:hypothetical protein